MSRYGSVNTGQPTLTRVVEAAEPEPLALRVNAAVAELALAGATVLTALSLAGAGDGHTFTVTIEAAAPAAVVGGITPFGGVRCYLASSAEALALARQAAALPAVLQPFVDSQVSGSSKGARFMGMLVYGVLQEGGSGGFAEPVQSIVQASSSRLVDLNATSFDSGTAVFVAGTVRAPFRLRRPSALVADNITVVDAVGGGQWLREDVPSLSWLYQPEWWVDPALGNDENDGSSALTALTTQAEFERRIGQLVPRVAVTVHIVGSSDAITAPKNTLGLTYVGETITPALLSGTLTAASPTDPATNFQQSVTSAGLGAFAKKRIRLTANNACANILVGGGDEVKTTTFLTYAGGVPTLYDPVGDEDFVVEDLPTCPSIDADAETGAVFVDNVRATTVRGTGITTTRCESRNLTSRGLVTVVGNFGIAQAVFDGDDFVVEGGGSFQFTFFASKSVQVRSTGLGALRSAYVVLGGPIGVGSKGPGAFLMFNTIMDGTNAWIANLSGGGIFVAIGSVMANFHRTYGTGNTSGLVTPLGALITYASAANKPTLEPDAWLIGGVAYSRDQVPIALSSGGIIDTNLNIDGNPVERIQPGKATLVNGVVTVGAGVEPIYITANSTIKVQALGGAGTVIGELTVDDPPVIGGPGVGAFTVRSLTLAGALVATDVRSFYYWISN
jgi:hypothetical protein